MSPPAASAVVMLLCLFDTWTSGPCACAVLALCWAWTNVVGLRGGGSWARPARWAAVCHPPSIKHGAHIAPPLGNISERAVHTWLSRQSPQHASFLMASRFCVSFQITSVAQPRAVHKPVASSRCCPAVLVAALLPRRQLGRQQDSAPRSRWCWSTVSAASRGGAVLTPHGAVAVAQPRSALPAGLAQLGPGDLLSTARLYPSLSYPVMRNSGDRPKHTELRALVHTKRGGESRRATGHLPTRASPMVLAPTCACSCRGGAVARLRPRAADLTPPRSKPLSPCAPPGTAGSRARCLTFPGKAFFSHGCCKS